MVMDQLLNRATTGPGLASEMSAFFVLCARTGVPAILFVLLGSWVYPGDSKVSVIVFSGLALVFSGGFVEEVRFQQIGAIFLWRLGMVGILIGSLLGLVLGVMIRRRRVNG
jgi:hypothetical protein